MSTPYPMSDHAFELLLEHHVACPLPSHMASPLALLPGLPADHPCRPGGVVGGGAELDVARPQYPK
jgi:hypothetical protein